MKISDEEIQAAIEAWFDGHIRPARDYSKDMRKVLKAALRIRKQLKFERELAKQLRPDEIPAAQANYDRFVRTLDGTAGNVPPKDWTVQS